MVDKINSHETSLHSLATGELNCPRLFVLIPLEKSGSQLSMLLKPKVPPPGGIKPVMRPLGVRSLTGCTTPLLSSAT